MTYNLLACLDDLLNVVSAHLSYDWLGQLQVSVTPVCTSQFWDTWRVHIKDMVLEVILIVHQFVRMEHLGVRQGRAVSSC